MKKATAMATAAGASRADVSETAAWTDDAELFRRVLMHPEFREVFITAYAEPGDPGWEESGGAVFLRARERGARSLCGGGRLALARRSGTLIIDLPEAGLSGRRVMKRSERMYELEFAFRGMRYSVLAELPGRRDGRPAPAGRESSRGDN